MGNTASWLHGDYNFLSLAKRFLWSCPSVSTRNRNEPSTTACCKDIWENAQGVILASIILTLRADRFEKQMGKRCHNDLQEREYLIVELFCKQILKCDLIPSVVFSFKNIG